MQQIILSVTATGTTGSASGTTTAGIWYNGLLHAVYFDTAATTASTQLRITENYTPGRTLCNVSTTADGWYFPRGTFATTLGVATGDTSAKYPVIGQLAFGVGTSVPTTHTAYIYIEEQG